MENMTENKEEKKKTDEATGSHLQDKLERISLSKKTPASLLQEYATKYKLVPHYDEIQNGAPRSKITFKCCVTLGDYESIGAGASKKEAKHAAALRLLRKMIQDNPILLKTEFQQWDFDKHIVSPSDNNIKVNGIGRLNETCTINGIQKPAFELVREEGQSHAKLFTIRCCVGDLVEEATHKTKKQAMHLASVEMLRKLSSIDQSSVLKMKPSNRSDSVKVLERVLRIKKNDMPLNEDCHLQFKKTEWLNSQKLSNFVEQHFLDGKLSNVSNPYEVLKNIAEQSGMLLTEKPIKKNGPNGQKSYHYFFVIDNVYPNVFGTCVNKDVELARNTAAARLLENICILYK